MNTPPYMSTQRRRERDGAACTAGSLPLDSVVAEFMDTSACVQCREPRVYALQQQHELLALGEVQCTKCLGTRLVGDLPDALQDRTCGIEQIQPVGAPILGVCPALDPAVLLHPVQSAYQRHRVGLG